jgi:ADP-heptose:LPS heptosyltransferase
MSIDNALGQAGSKPAGKRPYFLERETERVLAITMALVQELAVARQRLDTLERLLQAKGVLTEREIEVYAPDTEAAAKRASWTQEYIARVLRIVQQENEAAVLPDEPASEEVATEVAKPA